MYSSFHTSHYNQNEHSDSSLDPLDPELYADDFGEQRGGVSSSYSSSATSTSSSSSSSSFSKKRPKKNGHSSDSSSSSAPQVRDRRASTKVATLHVLVVVVLLATDKTSHSRPHSSAPWRSFLVMCVSSSPCHRCLWYHPTV